MSTRVIEYDLTIDDVIAWVRYQADHTPQGTPRPRTAPLVRIAVWSCLVAILALLIATNIKSWQTSHGTWQRVRLILGPLVLTGSALLFLMRRRLLAFLIRRAYSRPANARNLGRRCLAVDAGGLISSSAIEEIALKWEGIDAIRATPDHMFFVTGPGKAIVVPRTAFSKDDAFWEFVSAAERLHADAAIAGRS
jgi:YcxB-like protein